MGMTWNVPNLASVRGAALTQAAEALLEDAKARAPVESGELRESGYLALIDDDTVRVGFTAPYAVRQHFVKRFRHDEGGPGFLSDAVEDFGPRLEAIVAEGIRRRLGS